ncbi:DUF4383 domain-containing protein [Shimazuella alba]|jgi:phosphoglycerol transferase MdoB-like AlkP superfamily enzyme|uniref:DUF4383 domain-containing protein n=1 Tax=Shimazuella alba TaxID=2690964 RepID=A0A6I4VVB7_9BACL|nr:DUF4383 domain-containing protein [Shimazuella alba]MXQ52464.1 DUF4383 domain-containing protein [Shimazuella alba]
MVQGFSRVFGVIFLLLGVGGFLLPATGPIHDLLHLTAPHNIIHLLTGIIFLAASTSFQWSKVVSIIFGVVYAAVAILGLFMTDIFGLLTVTPAIEVIHFVLALLSLFVGFKSSQPTAKSQTESA